MSESTVPVFISWSGEPSRVVAQALATFINDCIQAAAPWTSEDIPKGTAWPDAILTKLQESVIGIVCVTKANQTSPWLLFEGGALAKHKNLHVFLIDAKPSDIKPPLGLYQNTTADKAEVLKLLTTIDAKVPEALRRGPEKLRRDCDKNWLELENAIEQARALLQTATPGPQRSDRELLEEIVNGVRGLGARAAQADSDSELRTMLGAVLAEEAMRKHASLTALNKWSVAIKTPDIRGAVLDAIGNKPEPYDKG